MSQVVVSEEDGLRVLRFGTHWCQGAMRIATPDSLELAYAVNMFAWLPFHDPDALPSSHLLTLGLGAGSLTRFGHRVLGMHATAVEIDQDVIAACRDHFLLAPDGERLAIVHGDAAAFLAARRGAADVDVLQVDAYDADVRAPVLDSEPFYADCRASLRDGGTVVVNLMGRQLQARDSVARLRRGLRPNVVWQLPPTASGNVIVVAHCGQPPSEEELAARAGVIEARWRLPAREWLATARRSAAGPAGADGGAPA